MEKFASLCMFTLLLALLSGCEKVIQVKTVHAAPQLVIESNLTNEAGPYVVKLNMSVNYDQSNSFPPVSNATVIIFDDAGRTDTLKEKTSGVYQTSTLQGIPGRQYTLLVTANGSKYRAVSKMPALIDIQKLEFIRSRFSAGKDDSLDLNCNFNDPDTLNNHYRFIQVYNGKAIKRYEVLSDKYYNGNLVKYTLSRSDDDRLKKGDSIQVALQSIDLGIYDYFNILTGISGENSSQTASPANPATNISGGALGYFSAHSVSRKGIKVP